MYFNTDRLKEFRGFGGVRLEDDVRITAAGCENLTVCPRAVEEILDVMKGGSWPREYSLCSLFILKEGNDDTQINVQLLSEHLCGELIHKLADPFC